MKLARAWMVVLLCCGSVSAQDWAPAPGKLMTRWAKDVSPEAPLPEYPRPQMVRDKWQNLNGLWEYAIRPLAKPALGDGDINARAIVSPDAGGDPGAAPTDWDGRILVPFCVESALSGVAKPVGPDNRLWYRRTFEVPADWKGQRVLLHFGAVDWQTTVWLNGKKLGEHRGGFNPFSFDLSPALKADGPQELVVAVWDPSNTGMQPCGKQHIRPHGIFYTPVTGIWQTVWIEPVAKTAIKTVLVTPDIDGENFQIQVTADGPTQGIGVSATCDFEHQQGDQNVKGSAQAGSTLLDRAVKLGVGPSSKWSWWTPENPKLFEFTVQLKDNATGAVVDSVVATGALRKIEVKKATDGFNRMFLNNEPVFQYGPLDQGWWPDGLYTAPTDEALKYDIEITKELGFNMCRKHVKVEPARWYHWCDKLGLLVWQDMPSGERFIGPNDPDITRSEVSEKIYREEWTAIIEALKPFGSIVVWVPFNEGWGQFKTNEILDWTKTLDPTRIIDGPSGWSDRGGGEMHDMHNYPGPGMFPPEDSRASVLGEFGGLGLPLEGHTWLDRDNWGYRNYESKEALGDAYANLLRQVPVLIGQGLAAAVYTQTTDVEVEVNGLLTYDREVIKFDVDRLKKLHERLYQPPPKVSVLVPTSELDPQEWRFTTDKPAGDWHAADFDDSKWMSGPGGFGTRETPGTTVRTEWKTPDIWCRREFEASPAEGAELALRIHHDEDAEIYLNGKLVASVKGYISAYALIPVQGDSAAALRPGKNVIAVHCHQTGGGQYIDVGLVELR